MQRAGSVGERGGSPDVAMRELAEAELRGLPVADLLAKAVSADITVAVEGDRLRVRGPQKAEALGRLLLERKSEVLAVLVPSRQQTAEKVTVAASQAERDSSAPADTEGWEAERAEAIVAEVDAMIDAALLADQVADNQARRNVLAYEKLIVRRLMWDHDRFLWRWPEALRGLFARWVEWKALQIRQSPYSSEVLAKDSPTSMSPRLSTPPRPSSPKIGE